MGCLRVTYKLLNELFLVTASSQNEPFLVTVSSQNGPFLVTASLVCSTDLVRGNFKTSDGYFIQTYDGKLFNVKE